VTFFSYGVLCFVVLIGFIIVNRVAHKAALTPEFMQNQFNDEDVEVVNSFNDNKNNNFYNNGYNNPEIETPTINDDNNNNNDNYYYDQISPRSPRSPKSPDHNNSQSYNMPVFSPHGIPSSNLQFWNSKDIKTEKNNYH
jgi:hypothetical protein